MTLEIPIIVLMDAADSDALLGALYESRPPRVHTLICACGNLADLRESAQAWDGWQVLPTPLCPSCRAKEFPNPLEGETRERYLALVEKLLIKRKVGA
jgi:hypothetical protein